jgi:putative transcriptional regulator
MTSSLAPGFLIATPQLTDDNFNRTVVLMIDHGPNGAFGVVINRPSDIRLSDLAARLGVRYEGEPTATVLIGGPVQRENILVVHGEKEEGGRSPALAGTVFIGADTEALHRLFRQKASRVLCFAGYAGWGPGQVESELERGSWIPAPLDPDLVFNGDRDGTWEAALRSIGIDPRFLVPGDSDQDPS